MYQHQSHSWQPAICIPYCSALLNIPLLTGALLDILRRLIPGHRPLLSPAGQRPLLIPAGYSIAHTGTCWTYPCSHMQALAQPCWTQTGLCSALHAGHGQLCWISPAGRRPSPCWTGPCSALLDTGPAGHTLLLSPAGYTIAQSALIAYWTYPCSASLAAGYRPLLSHAGHRPLLSPVGHRPLLTLVSLAACRNSVRPACMPRVWVFCHCAARRYS